MLYTVQNGDTWNSVAATYTLGGAAYGPGLANVNGVQSATGAESLYPDQNTITIPDNWLITSTPVPTATSATSGLSSLLKSPSGLAAIGVAAYLWFNRNKGGSGAEDEEFEDAE